MSDLRRTLTNNRRRLLSERPGSIDIDQGEGANLIDNEEIASSLPTDYSIGRFLENEVVPIRPNRSFVINDSNSMGRDRLPYHVPASMPAFSRAESVVSLTSMDRTEYNRQQNMAIRYRLFNALDPGGSRLTMPDHILPNEFFSILPFDDFNDESGKQGSIVTIFSIWNTMMGTSLLAMPWALGQAGFALGSFLILLMAAISLYTAYRVIQSPNGLILPVDSAKAEVSDVCRYFWGSAGEYVSVFVSIITLVGGILVYWVLMSNFLFYTVNVFHDAIQPNSSTIPSMANKTFKCDVVCPDNTPHQNFKFASFYLHPLTEEASFWDYKNVCMSLLRKTFSLINILGQRPLSTAKPINYVGKMRVLNHWSENCNELDSLLPKAQCILIIDDKPLVKARKNLNASPPELVKFNYSDLQFKLNEYGLSINSENMVLLDALPPFEKNYDYAPMIGVAVQLSKPEPDSGIDFDSILKNITTDLGGECIYTRSCILTMTNSVDRNMIAKLRSTIKWHQTYRCCPSCGGMLSKKLSKSSCSCANCRKNFYPVINPVAMVLIVDEANENVLLVRHLNGIKGVCTVIAGFATAGESIRECAKREVAEETGIEMLNLFSFDGSQPWPHPDNSLILPFYGTAQKIDIIDSCPKEIEHAGWFSRSDVIKAINTSIQDPNYEHLAKCMTPTSDLVTRADLSKRLFYVPPPGAIAHSLLKAWAFNPKMLANQNLKLDSF
uniref:Nudix hydrolase domain-containing protein n=1 Tax=Rhabditophanes sp. KR3021 TaxID=114890 RepID=A0AC35THY4_9BILA